MPFCIPSSSKTKSSSPYESNGKRISEGGYVNGSGLANGSSGRPKKPLSRKLVVLGDGACGKTSMLTVFTQGHFPEEYEPTVFENYVETMTVDNQSVELSLWDTAGQEEFDRLRSLSYADTHVIMICFSVERPESLENVEAKWIGEVEHYCPDVVVILVALKCDLREDPLVAQRLRERGYARGTLSYEDGLNVAKRIRAARYLECSAKEARGVKEVIEEGARVAIGKSKPAQVRTLDPVGSGGGGGGGKGGAGGGLATSGRARKRGGKKDIRMDESPSCIFA